jgi:hypothetical protein
VRGRPCDREEEEEEGGEQSKAHPLGTVTWVPACAGMTLSMRQATREHVVPACTGLALRVCRLGQAERRPNTAPHVTPALGHR